MSLLNDGKLARTIASALAGVMYPITIKRTTAGVYVPGGGYTPGTTTTHTARGMVDSPTTQELQAGLIEPGDRKVTLLTQGLTITPSPATDKVVLGGIDLTIIAVTSDPAGATFVLRVR